MTDLAITIRRASKSDSPAIYAILCALENQSLDQLAFETVFDYNLNEPMVYYFVAECEEQVVGFISGHVQLLLHHTGPVGEIQELFVQPELRGQNVGRQLVSALEAAVKPLGIQSLEVTSNRQRADALRFYESLGFQPTHVKLVKQP